MNLSKRTVLFLAAICMLLLAEGLLAGRASLAADDCITKPNAVPPQGSHWYYRTDRATQRQCWYLASEAEKASARLREPSPVMRPPPAPNLVSTPSPQALVAAPVETKAAEDDPPAEMASVEPSGLRRSNHRMGDDASGTKSMGNAVRINNSRAYVDSAKEVSDVAIAAPSDLEREERPPESAIAFAHLLALLAAVLALVAIIVRTIFNSTVHQSARIKPHDRSHLASEPPGLGEHIESPSLAEHNAPKLSNSDAAAHPDVIRPSMGPIRPPAREYSWAEIETSVRLLLQELQQRQNRLRGNDFEPTRASDLDTVVGAIRPRTSL